MISDYEERKEKAVEKRNYAHITYEQRLEIKNMIENKVPIREIAKKINLHYSTIYREIKKYTDENGRYLPENAQSEYEKKLHNKKISIIEKYPHLASFISEKILIDNMSPQQIEEFIKSESDLFRGISISRNTIYTAIDKGIIPGVTRENLHSPYTTMYSDGLLRVPKWILEKIKFSEGDRFLIDFSVNGQITFKKE